MIPRKNRNELADRLAAARSCCACLLILTGLDSARLASQQPAAPVVVANVESIEISPTAPFIATFRPSQRAVIGSAVAGRVETCHVREGDRVLNKQPLVQILTNTIDLELKAAEATLALRISERNELQSGLRPGEVEQAKAKMLAAKARADLARIQLSRTEELRQSNAVTEDGLDTAKAAFDESTQMYLELKSAYDLALEGNRPEKIDQAEANVAIQNAEVELIKTRISKYTVRTRFDGYVVKQLVDEGAWVLVGEPVMEVVALDEVELVAAVNDEYVRHIRTGASVDIKVAALPGETFSGTVQAVVPQADLQARTFPVIIRVKNQLSDNGPLLKSGMVARVDLPTARPQQAVLIPKDALVLGGPSKMVYVVSSQPSSDSPAAEDSLVAVPVPVETGISKGNWIQVRGDLKAGQQVVIEGNERLRKNQPVRVQATRSSAELGLPSPPTGDRKPDTSPQPHQENQSDESR